jgi:dihydroxyacetone synthase
MLLLDAACLRCKVSVSLVSGPMTPVKMVPLISQLRKPEPLFLTCKADAASISLGTFFRALPNFNLIRPADAEEVLGAWEVTPTLMCLTRQPVPLLDNSGRSKVHLGAYPVFVNYSTSDDPELVLIASGSEVAATVEAAKRLSAYCVRVVSMPVQSLFDRQPALYRREVLATGKALAVGIEAWGSYGWARYAHASLSMHTFGLSARRPRCLSCLGLG